MLAVQGGLRVFSALGPRFISLFNIFKTATGGGGVGRRTTEASTRSRTPAMDNSANPNIHTIVKAQIVFLLSTLTEENFERNQVEIRSVRARSFAPRSEVNEAQLWGHISA